MQENLGKANEKSNLRKHVRQMCAAQSPEILYHSPTFPFHCIAHTINSQFLTHKNLRKTKLVRVSGSRILSSTKEHLLLD